MWSICSYNQEHRGKKTIKTLWSGTFSIQTTVCRCASWTQSLCAFPSLTHWFLDDSVVVRGIICIHWLQERPRHLMCLRRRDREIKRKTRHLRKLKPKKENKQQHENDTRSRWVNTDVPSCSFLHLSLTKQPVNGGRKEKKNVAAGSCPSSPLESQSHQIRCTQRTFVFCSCTVVGRWGAGFTFGPSLPKKLHWRKFVVIIFVTKTRR